MGGLEPYVEDTTTQLVFSCTMLAMILLTLPLLLLYEKVREKRGRRIAPAISSTTTVERHVDTQELQGTGASNFSSVETFHEEVPRANNKGIPKKSGQIHGTRATPPPPTKLKHDRHDYTSTSEVTDSTTGFTTTVTIQDTSQVSFTGCESSLLSEVPCTCTESNISTVPDPHFIKPPDQNYCEPESRPHSPEIEEGTTQTSICDFDISRDCILIQDEIPTSEHKVITGKPEPPIAHEKPKPPPSPPKVAEVKERPRPPDPVPRKPVRYNPSVSCNRIISSRNCVLRQPDCCPRGCIKKSNDKSKDSLGDGSKSRFS